MICLFNHLFASVDSLRQLFHNKTGGRGCCQATHKRFPTCLCFLYTSLLLCIMYLSECLHLLWSQRNKIRDTLMS